MQQSWKSEQKWRRRGDERTKGRCGVVIGVEEGRGDGILGRGREMGMGEG
jgi:hypothetical protein